MSIASIKAKFDAILTNLGGAATSSFSTTVETAFEAQALMEVVKEYSRIHNGIQQIIPPSHSAFMNQKPGKFRTQRAFYALFNDGTEYYFATDVEVHGLGALQQRRPIGILFESDVVVIPKEQTSEVINQFNGYPGPQHLECVCECKFGAYSKSQLREILGLKRHLCFLQDNNTSSPRTNPNHLFNFKILNSSPQIRLIMMRPRRQIFFDKMTANLFDLQEVQI